MQPTATVPPGPPTCVRCGYDPPNDVARNNTTFIMGPDGWLCSLCWHDNDQSAYAERGRLRGRCFVCRKLGPAGLESRLMPDGTTLRWCKTHSGHAHVAYQRAIKADAHV